ncbi:ABC-2 transporter permease [Candidatus Galacturonibacter soehngenii]|uniref:ABC-2 transporter permease n=1 Tax=Candidatus Galacturonatibacter soehngenii TaxID=2307010 RepID=A0A7V7QMY6_9FIRM|nr:ABC-2 transporter permease [Candidatus Galacturonibacter soehngenii]KAB1440142.1 ABC-2 transporter permease [Candidatus Galacturonibacter soehngenii]
MYLSLIRKDYSIVLRNNIGLLIAQMLFILIIVSTNLGIMGYAIMAVSFGWQILMTVSAKDKMNHSMSLLLSMPFQKKTIVNARYMSVMLGFAFVSLFYIVIVEITKFFHVFLFKPLSIEVFFLTLCAYSLFASVTLPLYLKFEDSVVRGISLFSILGVTILGVLIWDNTNIRFLIDSMTWLKEYYAIICVAVIFLSITISRSVSMYFFESMEF